LYKYLFVGIFKLIIYVMKIADIRAHLKLFRVGIAGAGGLGSNCAAALARCGVGTIVISDFDAVDESNLNRQFYFRSQIGDPKTLALKLNIARIDPDITVVAHQVTLDRNNIPAIFKGCDIVIEAFDRAEMKEMLIETVQTEMKGVPVIAGSGVAGWGKSSSIKCRKIDDTLYICGDEASEVSEDLPPMAPRVGIVASMQANVAVEIMMEMKKNS
jgi:sulfur carrier protein ThiS adenylyltransferase